MTHDAELSCDFLFYLGQRLGKSQEATIQLLGDWLSSYEPQHLLRASSLPPVVTLDDERLSA